MKVFKRHLAPAGVAGFLFFMFLGTPLYVLGFQAGWDIPSTSWAAIAQCVGSALACLWGSWLLGDTTTAQERHQMQQELLKRQQLKTDELDKRHRLIEQFTATKKGNPTP